MNVLALNAGSSSIKYQLVSMPDAGVLAKGNVEHAGIDGAAEATGKIVDACREPGIDAVGHRIVHGGAEFQEPALIDREVVSRLRTLEALDPLHNPVQLALIDAASKRLPNVPHVAAFDTAFHRTIPDVAALYALPQDVNTRLKLRRYGFHGLSHSYVSRTLLELLGRSPEGSRLITCHLGNGASVCAVKNGVSVDTSMGLTPLEGLVMGTRSGDVDPGLILYLMREQKLTVAEVDNLLNNKSGLLGLSGLSADVRTLTQALRTNPQAALALDIFAYRVRKYIGAYAAAMGGVDAIAFTGGIGEHSPEMRSRICEGLGFLGIDVDSAVNRGADGKSSVDIGMAGSSVPVWVIATNEELEIARSVVSTVRAAKSAPST